MLKYVCVLILFCWSLHPGLSQNNHASKPQQLPYDNIEYLVMPVFNNSQLRTAERIRYESGGGPLMFAKSHKTHISPKTNGSWESLSDGHLRWSLIIKSSNAYSLNLGFKRFHLPHSARLTISSIDQTSYFGPFTSKENEDHGEFWTPLINGDEVLIQLIISPEQISRLILELNYINHDFTGFGKAMLSGSCNLDVVCGALDGWPEVDDYRDIIRSTGAYFFQSPNGTAICSGALINNARQDCTPYFLTAFHCGINTTNAASMVFVWNYQNSRCRQPGSTESGQPGDGQKTQFNSGAILRANYEDSDMTLVEMDDEVNPDYKPFFAGWNAETALPASTLCIHHPGVTEKRISFDYDPPILDGDTNILVSDWDIGTTEGGSSGSPLYNRQKQIIGQLTGGFAACGNDESDSYGWIQHSWEGGGTPATSLRSWLDPDNQGILVLDGHNCGFGAILSETSANLCTETTPTYTFSLTPNNFVDTTLYVSLLNLPNGISAASDKDSLQSGESATITLSNLNQLNSGTYILALLVSSEIDTSIVYFNLVLTANTSLPPSLIDPVNGHTSVHFNPQFVWNSTDGESWEFQLDSEQTFQNPLFDIQNLQRSIFSLADDLEIKQRYYWRVRANNFCGTSDWSDIFSFTTGNIRCFEIFAQDLPIKIDPNDLDTIMSSLFVPNGGILKDLEVIEVSGDHSWSEDLRFTLIGPNDERAILLSEKCGSNDNFNFNIDDESSLSSVSCPLNQGISYPSNTSLSIFDESNPRGQWGLEVMDLAAFDGGELQAWGLKLCLDITNDFSAMIFPEGLSSCGDDQLETEIFVGAGFIQDVNFSALSKPENIVTFSPNPASPGTRVVMTISNIQTLASGSYTFSYTATDGTNTTEESVSFLVNNGPKVVNLISPVDQQQNIDLNPMFAWEEIAGLDTYLFELSIDTEFTEIIESVQVSSASYNSTVDLEELTSYFWRISASNECGTSVSNVFSFETTMSSSVLDLGTTYVNIFPNPVSEDIHLFFERGTPEGLTIKLINVEGKTLLIENLKQTVYHSQLKVSDFLAGIYFLQLSNNKNIVTEKIIIE